MTKLYNELNGAYNNPGLKNLKSVMKQLQTLSNPSQTLTELVRQNPSIKQILAMAQNQHVSLKELCYLLAKEKGVDPEEIIKELTNELK